MFGSIGGPELLLIFLVALLVFGPRKLPELGRMFGKGLAEFRRATGELRESLEMEVARAEAGRKEPVTVVPIRPQPAAGTVAAMEPSPRLLQAGAPGEVAPAVPTGGEARPEDAGTVPAATAPIDTPPAPDAREPRDAH